VVADCTGHSVPGAFMSVLGISLLNDIVGRRGLDPPAEILNELRKRIKKSLHQDNPETVNQDGMDIAFCCIDMETLEMQFSGAYNPLYLVRNGELLEYKANHMPVGVHPHDSENFTNHILHLQKGDAFYIFSDGYTSQFGGPEGKKFNTKPFKDLILGFQSQPMLTQKILFEKALADWQGKSQQVDDISVVGVRV
jgi:serine phosphatase RsbU (regulator of sigma subunit)